MVYGLCNVIMNQMKNKINYYSSHVYSFEFDVIDVGRKNVVGFSLLNMLLILSVCVCVFVF